MKKFFAAILALAMMVACTAALAEGEVQTGIYVVYNMTGEAVTELTLTDNVTGEASENLAPAAGEDGFVNGMALTVSYDLAAGEDGHGRLTLYFKTESGYEGKFETLSIEEAPITLLSADAMTGATQISFTVPNQVGTYMVYNMTGETVTELTITDNQATDEEVVNLAGEGLADMNALQVSYALPADQDGHGRLTLYFKTESGYEGKFETLSIEEAPITLLSADAMTGATQISFTAPVQTGSYTIYNLTGETVTELYMTDNVTGLQSENLAGEGLAADTGFPVTYSIPAGEDGHGRLTLYFKTESGYEGKFETLSIEEAPISLLSADAMTGATQISFTAPAAAE